MERRGFLARLFGGFLVALGLRPRALSQAEISALVAAIKEAYPKGVMASMAYHPKTRMWDDLDTDDQELS